MTYSKAQFANDINGELGSCLNVVRLSRLAQKLFLEHCRELEPGLQPLMMKIVAMEEGPEFELSAQQVRELFR